MRWIEVTVNCTGDPDLMCADLAELGVGGMIVEDEQDFENFLENNHAYWDYVDEELENKFKGVSRVKFYLSDDEEGKALLNTVANFLGKMPETAFVQDSDWENNWKEFYKPIEVGEKLVVVPEWEPVPEDGRIPLKLDPGLIFGTGSHATTKMCLAALESVAGPGKTVLDLGCGSGILGIGALLLGCDRCAGCDIDPKAPEVALSNAGLNGITAEQFDIRAGDVLSDAGMRKALGSNYDIVTANIVSDVIIPLSGFVKEFLKPGGTFITSGIIEGRQDEVRQAIEDNGFTILEHHNEDDWHCFVAR
ncbi:MAG: 50S ribosomal protein L11 methyltransferase [Oscillospiraceae bacterium]|nr:50S ribosomal protein L11 methyltransferase [Oscillospiraceae bacterium]